MLSATNASTKARLVAIALIGAGGLAGCQSTGTPQTAERDRQQLITPLDFGSDDGTR
jgi:hypothetical protein